MSDFEISVVIPVYNSEEYLGETLESVAAQTVGMDAVQVVIVDDGSTDGSAAICRSFQDRYPANVVFHQQPNGGVSSARNAGLDRASGRIVTCLDSDDQWTPESFAYAVDFFDNQENNVDVLVGELTLFEGEDHTHPLATVSRKTRIPSSVWEIAPATSRVRLGTASFCAKLSVISDSTRI